MYLTLINKHRVEKYQLFHPPGSRWPEPGAQMEQKRGRASCAGPSRPPASLATRPLQGVQPASPAVPSGSPTGCAENQWWSPPPSEGLEQAPYSKRERGGAAAPAPHTPEQLSGPGLFSLGSLLAPTPVLQDMAALHPPRDDP